MAPETEPEPGPAAHPDARPDTRPEKEPDARPHTRDREPDTQREMEIVHLLRAVAVELGLHSARFASLNRMHATDVRALIALMDALRAGEEMTAGRLGAALGLNSAGTTALLDRLEGAGRIRRVRDGADRRKVVVEVEEGAVELGRSFFGPLIERSVELLRGYDDHQLAAIRGFLGGVRQAAAEQSPDRAPGRTPSPAPSQAPNRAPGRTPNPAPSQAPNRAPGRTPNPAPSQAPNRAPGRTAAPSARRSPRDT